MITMMIPIRMSASPFVTAERTCEPLELRPPRSVDCRGAGDRQYKQIEFLDDETERDHRNAGAQPGEKCAFVCGMVGISPDHNGPL